MRFLPFLFLIVPVTEIAVFVLVGGQIGVMPTIGLVLLTAVIGTFLIRKQGLAVLTQVQNETRAGGLPAYALAEGAMLLVAAIFLLTPGFVTDSIGFSLFIPPVRKAIYNFLKKRVHVGVAGMGQAQRPFDNNSFSEGRHDSKGPTLDLEPDEFREKDDSR